MATMRIRQAALRLNAASPASVGLYSGAGAPSGDQGLLADGKAGEAVQVFFRNDAAAPGALLYVSANTGTTWSAVTV